MRNWIAVVACFGLPAIMAFYVALAPFGGALAPFDAGAATIIATAGQGGAVLGLLGLAVVLGLVAAFVSGHNGKHRISALELDNSARIPAWTPPLPPEAGPDGAAAAHADARMASVRRRALDDGNPAAAPHGEAPAHAGAPALPPPPVVLIRKPRERERDWFSDRSWLGGLPRLGDAPWPRDAAGVPLPFVAQIDLVELAVACPDSPLPRSGSLAFFLGSGAVVAVPEGTRDFSDPPHDVPPAFDEGGAPFPASPNRLTRWFFPFWPVEPVALDLPEHLRDHHNPLRENAIEHGMAAQLARRATLRDHPFYAAGVGAPVEGLWWHSVIHLADQLHEALDACSRPLAAQRAALDQKRRAFEQLRTDPGAAPNALAHAQESVEYLADELDVMETQSAALPDMVEALDQFVTGRDPWTALAPEELDVVADILADVHERFGELVRFHVPGSLAQLATLSLRAMVSGPPDTLAALPDDVLARINRDYRLPPVDQHQMFGLPANRTAARKSGRDLHRNDLLLLQLGYDDMMEWCWSEAGVYQFWIDPDDAAVENWNAARLTFESD